MFISSFLHSSLQSLADHIVHFLCCFLVFWLVPVCALTIFHIVYMGIKRWLWFLDFPQQNPCWPKTRVPCLYLLEFGSWYEYFIIDLILFRTLSIQFGSNLIIFFQEIFPSHLWSKVIVKQANRVWFCQNTAPTSQVAIKRCYHHRSVLVTGRLLKWLSSLNKQPCDLNKTAIVLFNCWWMIWN